MADAPGRFAGWRDDAEDAWGPARSVRSAGSASPGLGHRTGRSVEAGTAGRGGDPRADAVRAGTARRAAPAASAGAPPAIPRSRPAADASAQDQQVTTRGREWGLPGWGALLVLIAIAAVGGLIDMLRGTHVRGGFNIAIVVAALVAIVVVRRSSMFTVVVSPPIVYTAATLGTVYIRSGGLKDRKVLFDAAASWLVYGFPAIAAATAAVLIVAGIRLIIRR